MLCSSHHNESIITVGQIWSGFEFPSKLDQPGLSSWIQLEVIKDKKIFRLEVVM